jgi:hypothetical protein
MIAFPFSLGQRLDDSENRKQIPPIHTDFTTIDRSLRTPAYPNFGLDTLHEFLLFSYMSPDLDAPADVASGALCTTLHVDDYGDYDCSLCAVQRRVKLLYCSLIAFDFAFAPPRVLKPTSTPLDLFAMFVPLDIRYLNDT